LRRLIRTKPDPHNITTPKTIRHASRRFSKAGSYEIITHGRTLARRYPCRETGLPRIISRCVGETLLQFPRESIPLRRTKLQSRLLSSQSPEFRWRLAKDWAPDGSGHSSWRKRSNNQSEFCPSQSLRFLPSKLQQNVRRVFRSKGNRLRLRGAKHR
jgi:hypothetical protein